MSFSPEQIKELSAPLNRAHVKARFQAGRQLSYIEGWHAIAEANRIFGFDAWDRELITLKQLGDPREVDGKCRIAYMATVRIRVRTECGETVRDGTGYGSGIDRDQGQAHESAIKEAETDAMKRALMTFGNPFGLALYDKEKREVTNSRDDPPMEAQNPSDFDRLIALVNKATSLADLDRWLSAPAIVRIIGALSEEDAMRFNSIKATQEMNLGKVAT